MKVKPFNIIALLVFAAVVAAIGWNIVSDNRKGHYLTASPEIRTIEKRVSVPGHVYPAREIEIKSQLSGVLDSILVKTGDFVSAGDPVATVRLVPSSSDIEQMENNLKVARIEMDAAERSYRRDLDLFGKDAIPKSDMEATEKAYLISREQYSTARNQLDIMKHGFSSEAGVSNTVTASTSGTVIDIPVEPGTSVIERNTYNIGTTIAVLAETDCFVFKAKVPEQNLGYMSPGTHAVLAFNAYDSLRVDATITKVAAKGEETGTAVRFTVEAVFDMTSGMPVIRSGYSATAEILAARKDSVLSLKEKYLTFRNDSSYVYILDTVSGRPLLRTVSTGISDGEQIEITDGISLSDRIITNYDDTDD